MLYVLSIVSIYSHSPCFLKTAVPPSPMTALRHPRVIAPWSALEIVPSSVVAQTASTCITILAQTFRRLPFPLWMEAGGHRSFPSFPIFKWDGRTTLAGCKLALFDMGNIQQLIKREIPRDNAHGRVFQTELPDNQMLTVQGCIALCSSENFSLAGLEYSVQCCTFYRRRRLTDRPLVKER